MIPRLHLVTDDRILGEPTFGLRCQEVLEAGEGRTALHLRGPRTSGRRIWELGRALLPVARKRGVPVLVNDRVDVALVLGAEGAHLGARSLPVIEARRLLGPRALLGRSVHEAGEAREAARESGEGRGVDFLLAGTLFPTPSHPGAEGAGIGRVRAVVAACPGVPVVGIGGITLERAPEVLAAGAQGVAVIRAVWESPDPGGAVEALLRAVEGNPSNGKDEP